MARNKQFTTRIREYCKMTGHYGAKYEAKAYTHSESLTVGLESPYGAEEENIDIHIVRANGAWHITMNHTDGDYVIVQMPDGEDLKVIYRD